MSMNQLPHSLPATQAELKPLVEEFATTWDGFPETYSAHSQSSATSGRNAALDYLQQCMAQDFSTCPTGHHLHSGRLWADAAGLNLNLTGTIIRTDKSVQQIDVNTRDYRAEWAVGCKGTVYLTRHHTSSPDDPRQPNALIVRSTLDDSEYIPWQDDSTPQHELNHSYTVWSPVWECPQPSRGERLRQLISPGSRGRRSRR